MSERPYLRTQGEIVRGIASAMLRGSMLVMLAIVVGATVVAFAVVGPSGGWSALGGGAIALVLSLFTLMLITRTAEAAPQAVMFAALGGFLFKVILLVVVYALAGRIDGLHRESLAITMAAVFVVAAAAQSFAGSRVRMLTVVPESESGEASTSDRSQPDMSGAPEVPADRVAASGEGRPADDHGR